MAIGIVFQLALSNQTNVRVGYGEDWYCDDVNDRGCVNRSIAAYEASRMIRATKLTRRFHFQLRMVGLMRSIVVD